MKRIYHILWMFCSIALAGCYDDDSTMPASESDYLNEIVIEALSAQTAVSNSTTLEYTPTVSGFSDEQLSYAWYIYGDNIKENVEQGYRGNKISDEKTLVYPVRLKAGSYTVVLEVTHKEYGYAAIAEMSLSVNTYYSEGFYILKETADGNTNIDIYNDGSNMFLSNVLETPLQGKPGYIDCAFEKNFIDPTTAEALMGNVVMITAGENELAMYNSEDLTKVFDRSSVLYEEMEADEVPYRIGTTRYGQFFFTSKGVHNGGTGSTGKFSYPSEGATCASPFMQAADGYGLTFWDEQSHRLFYNNGYGSSEIEYLGSDIVFDNVECLATGWNYVGGGNTMWYLFEERAGSRRYLVFLNTLNEIEEVRSIPADSHLGQAEIIEGNTVSAVVIYAVHDGKMYSYSLDDGVETEAFTIQGLNGNIDYLRDTFFCSGMMGYDFNYIIIGTQNGNNYKLLFYNIQGGRPYGEPVFEVNGEGIVKEVCYVSQASFYGTPNFYPFTDYAAWGMSANFPYN